MAKTTEIDAQTKSRMTKLSKKTSEELIQIILRKDGTERKYAEKIKNQATELTRLQTVIKNMDADMVGTLEELDTVRDKNKKLQSNYDMTSGAIEGYEDEVKVLKDNIKKYKYVTICCGIIIVTLLAIIMF